MLFWLRLPATMSEDFDVAFNVKQTFLVLTFQAKASRPGITYERLRVPATKYAMRLEGLIRKSSHHLRQKLPRCLLGYCVS